MELGHVMRIIGFAELRHHRVATDDISRFRSRTFACRIGDGQRKGMSRAATGRTRNRHRQGLRLHRDAGRDRRHGIARRHRATAPDMAGRHQHGTVLRAPTGRHLFRRQRHRHGTGCGNLEALRQARPRLARGRITRLGCHGAGSCRQRRHQPTVGVGAAHGFGQAAVTHRPITAGRDRDSGTVSHRHRWYGTKLQIGLHGDLLLCAGRRPGGVTRLAGCNHAIACGACCHLPAIGIHRADAGGRAVVAHGQTRAGRGRHLGRSPRLQGRRLGKLQGLRTRADDRPPLPTWPFCTPAGGQHGQHHHGSSGQGERADGKTVLPALGFTAFPIQPLRHADTIVMNCPVAATGTI